MACRNARPLRYRVVLTVRWWADGRRRRVRFELSYRIGVAARRRAAGRDGTHLRCGLIHLPTGTISRPAVCGSRVVRGCFPGSDERRLLPGPSRFDAYVATLRGAETSGDILTPKEIRGLRLFIGKANCTQCHNGPLFTNHEFHNTGVLSFPGEPPDKGRVQGVREVMADPFNCLGPYSDGEANDCAELDFVRTGPELIGAMRTPSLRNLEGTAPFMHKGQLETLGDVLEHYNEAPAAMIGHNEAKPLRLGKRDLSDLEAFLGKPRPSNFDAESMRKKIQAMNQ